MKNEKVTKSWGGAALAVAFLVLIASAGISLLSVAQTRESPAKANPVTVQWQPQSTIEARFHARLVHDMRFLKTKLEELAGQSVCPDPDQWAKAFSGHFLKSPRLWADGELTQDWKEVLTKLHGLVRNSKDITVNFAWGMIEYVPFDKEKRPKPEEDVDFRMKIKVSFSASPGDNILEGELRHRRICEIGS